MNDAVRIGIAAYDNGKLVWRVTARVEQEDGLGGLPIWTLPARR